MEYREMLDRLAETRGRPKKEVYALIEAYLAMVQTQVCSTGRVHVPKFGVFSVRSRKARTITNPQTGKPMRLPRSKTVGFRVARAFRSVLQ